MDWREFLDTEQEEYLDLKYSLPQVKRIAPTVNEHNYQQVRKGTKTGINKGIQDWLKKTGAKNLYDTDLGDFCFDTSVQERVGKELENILGETDKKNLAIDVQQSYGHFVYNRARTNASQE